MVPFVLFSFADHWLGIGDFLTFFSFEKNQTRRDPKHGEVGPSNCGELCISSFFTVPKAFLKSAGQRLNLSRHKTNIVLSLSLPLS